MSKKENQGNKFVEKEYEKKKYFWINFENSV